MVSCTSTLSTKQMQKTYSNLRYLNLTVQLRNRWTASERVNITGTVAKTFSRLERTYTLFFMTTLSPSSDRPFCFINKIFHREWHFFFYFPKSWSCCSHFAMSLKILERHSSAKSFHYFLFWLPYRMNWDSPGNFAELVKLFEKSKIIRKRLQDLEPLQSSCHKIVIIC